MLSSVGLEGCTPEPGVSTLDSNPLNDNLIT
jgi:hypothetical protein